jgi:large subunit ribosomal protein L7Ae
LAITNVHKEDEGNFAKLVETINTNYNERFEEIRKQWGGGIMSQRTQHNMRQLAKAKEIETALRNN